MQWEEEQQIDEAVVQRRLVACQGDLKTLRLFNLNYLLFARQIRPILRSHQSLRPTAEREIFPRFHIFFEGKIGFSRLKNESWPRRARNR